MYNSKTNELEKEVVKVLGEKCHLAITDIRAGDAGYFVRIEANGLPFTVRSFEKTLQKAEELAIKEFKKQMEIALENDMFHTQPEENYWDMEVLKADTDKIYDGLLDYPEDWLNNIKASTTIKMCKLENGQYECVIDNDEMRIHVRSTFPSMRFAKLYAIRKAREVLNPELLIVGERPER